MISYHSHSIQDTWRIARRLLTTFRGGDVVFLVGGLGSGKTAFTQGLGKALEVRRTIQSPTFVLSKEYVVPITTSSIRRLVHLDAYRCEHPQEIFDLGWSDFAGQPDTLTIVENPTVLASSIRPDYTIEFTVTSPDKRTITVRPS